MKKGIPCTHSEMVQMELHQQIKRLGSLSPKRILHRDDLQPGDHICTDRNKKIYYHHGIYVGDGQVIHFTKVTARRHARGKDLCDHIEGKVDATAHPTRGVRLICLDCFLRSHSLNRVEYGLRVPVTSSPINYSPETSKDEKLWDDAETVVKRAWEKLEKNDFGGYNLWWRNCETFAYFCKTGEDYPFGSKQTQWLCEFYLGASELYLNWNGSMVEQNVLDHHFGHLLHHFHFSLHVHAKRPLVEPITVEAGYRGVTTQGLFPWHFHCRHGEI